MMHEVGSDEQPAGLVLIKKSAWLGAKIAFLVLAPICFLVLLVMLGLLSYQSLRLGMTPVDVLRAMGNASDGGETALWKFLKGLAAGPMLVAFGVLSSAITGGLIGALAAGVAKRRKIRR